MASNRQKDFIAEIKTKGIARTNRFTVDLTPPQALAENVKRMLLFCEKATLPGINFTTTTNRSYGETREVVYDRTFEPVTLTFHVDRKMTVKNIFDDWATYIINPVNRQIGWYNSYTTNMTIRVQDLEDKTTYYVYLAEVYPKTIVPISMDAGNNNDTMRLDVSFQYKYWLATPIQVDDYTGLEKSAGGLNKYLSDFTGFQEKYLKGLGEAGNILTGAVGQFALRGMSSVASKIPPIRF